MGRNGHSQDKDDALVSGFELLHPKPIKISKCSALGRIGSSFRCMGWRMLRAWDLGIMVLGGFKAHVPLSAGERAWLEGLL